MSSKKAFLEKIKDLCPGISQSDLEIIDRAYEYGKLAHKGQTRANGDKYFNGHCVPVAIHIAELGMDATLICAALLHDTIEDTGVSYDDIKDNFDEDVANLVDGVSKLGKLKYRGNERHVESLRKFFVSIAQDVRVVILKMADRWHNLETLHYLPKEKQQRIAQESILIYAPLASRLGMGKLVTIINDLAFPYAYPEQYKKTKDIISNHIKKADDTIQKMYRTMSLELHNS
ncbi:HD domain-containing protein, partial [Candidatus Saccharibacteria bacterium]|nr:HD domain-containing protein [Candidatus Saccharibacteria bacterium]